MVHNFLCAPSFKAWTPTHQELRNLTRNNKYYMAETPTPEPTGGTANPVTVSVKMTKQINITIDKRNAVSYIREDAIQLLARMERAGIYKLHDAMRCIICDIDKMERHLMASYQRELERTRNVRNFVLQKDNHRYCKLCHKHRPFEASDTLPRCGRASVRRHRMYTDAADVPLVPPADDTAHSVVFSYGDLLQMLQRTQDCGQQAVDAPNKCVYCSGYFVVCQCSPKRLSVAHDRVPMPTFYYRTQDTGGDRLSGARPIYKRSPNYRARDNLSDWFDYLTHPGFQAVRMPYTRMFGTAGTTEVMPFSASKKMAAKFPNVNEPAAKL